MKKRKKILVAMSGGVDSSVAAAILQKRGYEVSGGFMKNFSEESWKGVIRADCPWEQDQKDVQKVCKVLKIPYYTFNFEKEYKNIVLRYFFQEYKRGRTPNPDILCNNTIKFGLFLQKALNMGFDGIATGHYVRLRRKFPISKRQSPKFELLKGLDQKKDQSYFLYGLRQNQLSKALFPIGGMKKADVRKMAFEYKLSNADKKDSQGLCFVGHIRLKDFLAQRLPKKKGKIVDTRGDILGEHDGAWFFTLGQRHGLNIGGGTPYYVIEKNVKTNTLVVARGRDHKKNYKNTLELRDILWSATPNYFPFRCKTKIRYQQKDQSCIIKKRNKRITVKFSKPQFAITPGQACVFYKGSNVLGGGIINKSMLL